MLVINDIEQAVLFQDLLDSYMERHGLDRGENDENLDKWPKFHHRNLDSIAEEFFPDCTFNGEDELPCAEEQNKCKRFYIDDGSIEFTFNQLLSRMDLSDREQLEITRLRKNEIFYVNLYGEDSTEERFTLRITRVR